MLNELNAKRIQDISDQLEQIVDRNSLPEVVEALSLMCFAKADHIEENWQDSDTAAYWNVAAEKLLHLNYKLANEFSPA